jgi:hypothetical protein
VPPIHQPEPIAQAILRVAEHPPRERWLGLSTVKAIVGQFFLPGFLDRYLARRAWDAQVTNRLPPTTTDNLNKPLPGDRGAHGPFDDEALVR